MKNYDCIVVGSGITGLTASRILSQHGKRVLLLEKASILGGSLARFRVEGIPYDVGFHFTGGFNDEGTGVLDVMLSLLGVREQIRPVYFPRDACHRMVFPAIGLTYVVPCGINVVREKLKRDFPRFADGIDRYCTRFQTVIDATPTLSVSGFDEFPPPIEEDRISLQEVMDEYVPDRILQTILGGLCMCYGTRPSDASFATHCRVCFGLQESLARVEDGGDAFVDALVDVLKNDGIDIRTRCSIRQCTDIQNRRVGRFILTDGTEVTANSCIFTMHPQSILSVLPQEHLSKAFKDRVTDFESSNSFFTVYGSLDEMKEQGAVTLASILPDTDLNTMLTRNSDEPVDGAMMVLRSRERGSHGPVNTVTALEVAFPESIKHWAPSKLKRRPPEYYEYKRQRTESVVGRIREHIPECRDMRVIDSASSLTYRDYLHNPDGSAYGIRQKIGQLNLSGRLPISNLYAAGQSALLPGVIGSMTSAFFVCRGILGREVFREYLSGKLCCSSAR
ncbi:MAG TPA: NAD(P)/FAD-dependent oxidoreductase [Tepidisphaeraceae bacterium]|jgi:phytoene dehydrogenase-like protein|nr:NAD(P)/FAD-dependent oxidoreductase [Tepidisphaeraceae bacterium]